MSSIRTERVSMRARTLAAWSSAALASSLLAACGGGGGDSTPAQTSPPPVTPPPVTPTNAAPVANAGSAVTIALPTDSASLSGSATDDGLPSGSSISYTWEITSGPSGPNNAPGVVFANANAAATTARFAGGAGTYVLNLKASDGTLSGNSALNVTVNQNPNTYPDPIGAGVTGWPTVTPADEHMDPAKLDQARDYSIASAGAGGSEAGFVIRHGRLVYTWGDVTQLYDLKSTTKSMGGLALFLALDEGKLALTDKASARLPVFGTDPVVDTSAVTTGGLADISLLQLATHTAGFSKSDKVDTLKLLYTPGTTWSYSDQGLNWLADVLTQTYGQDLSTLMFSRVYTTLGIRTDDLSWRDNQFRSHTLSVSGVNVSRRELASGIHANVNAMARVGLLMLRQGVWNNQLLLSNAVVAKTHTPPAEVAALTNADPVNYPGATTNYGVLWWTNATGQIANVPTEAYWAWGLHETFIIVVPSLDLVIARAGDQGWHPGKPQDWNADYSILAPFLQPIVASVAP